MSPEIEPIVREGSIEDLKKKYKKEGFSEDQIENLIGESRKHSLIGSDVVTRSSGKETYPNEFYVFREMIQNCQRGYVDLEDYAEQKGLLDEMEDILIGRPVHIWIKKNVRNENEVHIIDFGYGIDLEHLEYFIGLKRGKDTGTEKYASWFGMGTFSADLMSEHMIVETSIPGSNQLLLGSIDFDFIRNNEHKKGEPDHIEHPDELLDKACGMWKIEGGARTDEHFTHVVLFIKSDCDPFERIEEIKDFIADSCPVPFNEWKIKSGSGKEYNLRSKAEDARNINPLARNPLSIYLNGEKLYKRYSQTELYDIQDPLYGQGRFIYTGTFSYRDKDNKRLTLAKYWYVTGGKRGIDAPTVFPKSENSVIGLYVDGFLWDKPLEKGLMVQLAKKGHGKRPDVQRNYLGEIHVKSNRYIHPNQSRTNVAGGPYWDEDDGQLRDQISEFADDLGVQKDQLGNIEKFRREGVKEVTEQVKEMNELIKRRITSRLELESLIGKFKKTFELYKKLGPPKGSVLHKKRMRAPLRKSIEQLVKDDLPDIDRNTTVPLEKIKKEINNLEKKYPASGPAKKNRKGSKKKIEEKWHIIITKKELQELLKMIISRKKIREKVIKKMEKFKVKAE